MTHQYQTLTLELLPQGLLLITLNRPDKLNSLSRQTLEELQHLFHACQKNASIKGVILTGNGKAFCAGADITGLAELTAAEGYEFARFGQTVFSSLENMGKPSIAAINGHALGGGCELAMAATLRIASSNAQFGQPEVKLGVIPGYGGTQRLTRLIGKSRALELCLTGKIIKADTALQYGLVNEVVTIETLITRAKELLTSITELAPLAVRSILQVIHQGCELSLSDAFELEASHFGLTCATTDKKEGVNAFLQKRPAQFAGE